MRGPAGPRWHRHRALTLGATAIAVTLVGAGCGGGDGQATPTTTTLPRPTTTTIAPPGRPDPADQRAAERAVLRDTDLGRGWKGVPWPEGHQPFLRNVSGACGYLAVVEDPAPLTARAHSRQIGNRATGEVAVTKIQTYPDDGAAAAVAAAFADPRTPACLAQAIGAFVQLSGPGGLQDLRFEPVALATPGAVGYAGALAAAVGAPGGVRLGMAFGLVRVGRNVALGVAYRLDGGRPALDPLLAPVARRLGGPG